MHVRFEAFADVRGDLSRAHRAVGLFVDAGDLPGRSRHSLAVTSDHAFITDGSFRDLSDHDRNLELLLEPEWTVVLAGGGDTRPPDVRFVRMNAQSRVAPERMLSVFEVAKVIREMDDPSRIRLGEY